MRQRKRPHQPIKPQPFPLRRVQKRVVGRRNVNLVRPRQPHQVVKQEQSPMPNALPQSRPFPQTEPSQRPDEGLPLEPNRRTFGCRKQK